MAKFENFEDIAAWKKGRELAKALYQETSSRVFAKDFALWDQIGRSAVSIMANIAGGFERGGDKEFRQFLAMAKGSIGELKSHLYIAADAGFLSREKFTQYYQLASEIGKLLGGLMRYLTASDLRGPKFK